MNQDEPFIPDTIDEQIDLLASMPLQSSLSPEEQVIQRLHTLYQADQRSTERVWGRLAPRLTEHDADAQTNPRRLQLINESHKERKHPMQSSLRSIRRTGSPRLAQVAAVIFAVLLVGSLLLVLHMAQSARLGTRSNQTTQTGSAPDSVPSLYISRSDGVYRLDARTRKVIWHTRIPGQSQQSVQSGQPQHPVAVQFSSSPMPMPGQRPGTPTVVGNAVYITANGRETALNRENGAILWSRTEPLGMAYLYTDSGLLYFTTNGDFIYAVNPANGAIVATYKPLPGQEFWGGPVVAGGILYYVSHDSILYALRLPKETLLWQQPLSNYRLTFPPYFHDIVIQNGVVYVPVAPMSSQKGKIDAFAAQNGKPLWQSPAIIAAGSTSAITVTDTMVYAANWTGYPDDSVMAFNIHSGALVWQEPFAGAETVQQVDSGLLYLVYDSSSNLGQVAALNATTGKMIWETTGNGFSMDGLLDGVVYGESLDTPNVTIYGLNASTGAQLWAMSEGSSSQWGGMAVA
jgi:outer membrane protein assembly factor BamB